MKIIKGVLIQSQISVLITDLMEAMKDPSVSNGFQIICEEIKPNSPPGIPAEKSIKVTVIKDYTPGVYGVYTFKQTIDECLGRFITAFWIAPSSESVTDSVIYPNVTPHPHKGAYGNEFFNRLYDKITTSTSVPICD